MDKFEYRVKTEQMLEYLDEKKYRKAMEIADTIDWRRVKNASMLNSVSEIYENCGEYNKSRDILMVAYDKSPGSRKIVYRMALLALKENDVQEAAECYDEYAKLAPKDPNRFILKYKVLRAQRAPLDQQIAALEDFKKAEYVEKWAYELAKLYHEAGKTAECLEECDDLILWFSEGKYVYQAMELKMRYKPLTPSQQESYNNRHQVSAVQEKPEMRRVEKKDRSRFKRIEGGGQTFAAKRTEEDTVTRAPIHVVDNTPEANVETFITKDSIKTPASASTLEEALASGVLISSGREKAEQGDEDEAAAPVIASEETVQEAQTEQVAEPQFFGKRMAKESPVKADTLRIDDILLQWEEQQKINAEMISKKKAELAQEAEAKAAPSDESAPILSESVQKLLDDLENGDVDAVAEDDEAEVFPEKSEPETPVEEKHENMGEVLENLKLDLEEDEDIDEENESKRVVSSDEDEDDFEDEELDDEEYEELEDEELDEEEYDDEELDEEEYEELDDEELDEEEYEELDDEEFDEEEYEELDDEEFDEEEYEELDDEEFDEEEYEELDDEEFDEEEYEVLDDEEYDDEELDDEEYDDEEFDDEEYDDEEFDDEEYEDDEEFEDDDESFDADDDFEEYEDDEDLADSLDSLTEDDEDEVFADLAGISEEAEAAPKSKKIGKKRKPQPEPTEEPLEIEEPSDEEIERRLRRSKGGVSYDTGFVVQGRYDLSATSEIGLKAGLSEEQKKLFSYFVPVRGVSEQIVDVLEGDKRAKKRYGTSRTGNILVVGRKGSGKTVLAVNLVKAIQKQRKIKQGKVAIVTGDALNKKELGGIVSQLSGGAIIIEKAGKLNARTVKEFDALLGEQTGELLVVLEDQRKPLERMLAANPSFKKKFTSKIELPVFINDELVTFGQTYANENGYKIDDMGILALYSRIDVNQREDHAVTVTEVKEIMDEAISRAQKNGMKHFVKRVFGKSTDAANYVLLKEEDFRN